MGLMRVKGQTVHSIQLVSMQNLKSKLSEQLS